MLYLAQMDAMCKIEHQLLEFTTFAVIFYTLPLKTPPGSAIEGG